MVLLRPVTLQESQHQGNLSLLEDFIKNNWLGSHERQTEITKTNSNLYCTKNEVFH